MSQPPDGPRSGPDPAPEPHPYPPEYPNTPPAHPPHAPSARGAAPIPGHGDTAPPDRGQGDAAALGGGSPPGGSRSSAHGSDRGLRRRLPLLLAVVGATALVLSAGLMVAWLVLRDTDQDGAETPNAAVQSFLQAVYRDHDAATAADLVCSEARDEDALATRIEQVRAYEDTYPHPRFRWNEPEVVDRADQHAVVTVTVTLTTSDEQVSQRTLEAQVLDKDTAGWWVCDLATVEPESDDGDPDEGDDTEENGEPDDGGSDGDTPDDGDAPDDAAGSADATG